MKLGELFYTLVTIGAGISAIKGCVDGDWSKVIFDLLLILFLQVIRWATTEGKGSRNKAAAAHSHIKIGDFVRAVQHLPYAGADAGGPDPYIEGVYVGDNHNHTVQIRYGMQPDDIANCYSAGLFPIPQSQLSLEQLRLQGRVRNQLNGTHASD